MKYPNGYLDKIDYWTLQLSIARNTLNFTNIQRAADKILYFSMKHQSLIDAGKMVPGQSGTMSDPEEDTINDPLYALEDMDPAGGYGLSSHI